MPMILHDYARIDRMNVANDNTLHLESIRIPRDQNDNANNCAQEPASIHQHHSVADKMKRSIMSRCDYPSIK
ncbi:hypothetical protein IAQ61_010794 [Plenodomus lingam]|uniref:uncharacterized protein n=1 Tax=Leptosphaeria maculans TaxID=5022 RepID=UPI00332BD5B6|nr:hypothetical protein IAQ61_010794 [Plenodomus lingam]